MGSRACARALPGIRYAHRRPSRLLGGVVVARLCRRSGASSSPQPSAGAFLDGRLDECALGIAALQGGVALLYRPELPRRLVAWLTKRDDLRLTADGDVRDSLDQEAESY